MWVSISFTKISCDISKSMASKRLQVLESLGAIKKKPAVIESDSGDLIGIRHMMFLSHSYDHRNIDGALGGQFVRKVADYLENFDVNRAL